jgi:hypothetical protein
VAKEFLSDLQTLLGQVDSFGNKFRIIIEFTKHQCSTSDGKKVFWFYSVFCYLQWAFYTS